MMTSLTSDSVMTSDRQRKRSDRGTAAATDDDRDDGDDDDDVDGYDVTEKPPLTDSADVDDGKRGRQMDRDDDRRDVTSLDDFRFRSAATPICTKRAPIELEMPWSTSSSFSSPRSCGSIAAGLVTTSTGARSSMSPGQQRSRTLDSSSWRKQVCEVRPNRSSTLGRLPTTQKSADGEDKSSSTALGLNTVSSPSVTADSLQRPRIPRPPARSSSDCCRCRWLRAASTSLPTTDPAGRGQDTLRCTVLDDVAVEGDGHGRGSLGLPAPPPPPVSRFSSELVSTDASVKSTSRTVTDFCVHVDEVNSSTAGSGSGSCLLHADVVQRRAADVGRCSVAASGSARYCLEDIREQDETSTIDEHHHQQPGTIADPRRLAPGCSITTFV